MALPATPSAPFPLSGTLHASLTHIRTSTPAERHALTCDGRDTPASGAGASPGRSRPAATYLLGPDVRGKWAPISVLSIKHKELSATCAHAGQTATFHLQVHDARTRLRRGMVIREVRPLETVAAPPRPLPAPASAVWELEAVVDAICLPIPVPIHTEIVLHCVAVKQAARLLSVDGDGAHGKLHPRRRARLRLRFVHAAEFVRVGSACVLRDGSPGVDHLSVSVGTVVSVSDGTVVSVSVGTVVSVSDGDAEPEAPATPAPGVL